MKKMRKFCLWIMPFLIGAVITIFVALAIITFLPGGNIGWTEYEHFGSGRTIAQIVPGMQINEEYLNEITTNTLEIMRQKQSNNYEHLMKLSPRLEKRADMVDVAYKGSSCVVYVPIASCFYYNENPADAQAIEEFVEIALGLMDDHKFRAIR